MWGFIEVCDQGQTVFITPVYSLVANDEDFKLHQDCILPKKKKKRIWILWLEAGDNVSPRGPLTTQTNLISMHGLGLSRSEKTEAFNAVILKLNRWLIIFSLAFFLATLRKRITRGRLQMIAWCRRSLSVWAVNDYSRKSLNGLSSRQWRPSIHALRL